MDNNVDWVEIYKIHREQVRDENELYNQRVSWLIWINALLFATVGLLFQSINFSEASAVVVNGLFAVIIVLAVTGAYLSKICRRLLDNAANTLNEVKKSWNSVRDDIPKNAHKYFLHPSGGFGGTRTAARAEDVYKDSPEETWLRSRYIPDVFVYSWSACIIITIYIWINYAG